MSSSSELDKSTQLRQEVSSQSQAQLPKARVSTVSPHNRAVYEAGKDLLIESVEVGREFCKFMITMSTGAIPIYIAMLKLVGIETATTVQLSVWFIVIAVMPSFLYLASTILYIFGYFPSTGAFSLDVIEEIELARKRVIQRRRRLIVIATILFIVGVLTSIVVALVTILLP